LAIDVPAAVGLDGFGAQRGTRNLSRYWVGLVGTVPLTLWAWQPHTLTAPLGFVDRNAQVGSFGCVAAAGYTVPIRRVHAFVECGLLRGWDMDSIMLEAGISPLLLAEQRARVTTVQTAKLIQLLWAATDDELMGLGPAPMPRGTFRLLSFALLSSKDVETALARGKQFCKLLPGIPPVRASTAAGFTTLSVDLSGIGRSMDLLIDSLLATLHRLLGWAIGRRVPLARIEVPYYNTGDVDDYDLIFGAPVVFGARTAALVFGSEILTAPLVRSDAELEQYIRNSPGDIIARRDYGTSLSDRVRRMLKPGRHEHLPSMDDIAVRLAMSPQTVRRKLHEENTSLRQIREEILRDAAIASLSNGGETIAALSDRLGFSEPSAFTRAFRRWTGSPPSSYRPEFT
jgi:AraC-like DNA-binding protein